MRGRPVVDAEAAPPVGVVVVPALCVALIFGLDELPTAGSDSVPLVALVDWPGHLATALLGLLAVAGPGRLLRHRLPTVTALAASVLIDLDHVAVYLGYGGTGYGRTYAHSLVTVAGFAVAGLLWRRGRGALLGAAVGVLLHYARDLFDGPGLPLLWPWEGRFLLAPYDGYRVLVIVLGVLATARAVTAVRGLGVPARALPGAARRPRRPGR